jgi:Fe-S cluster biogenesis protein NfuA
MADEVNVQETAAPTSPVAGAARAVEQAQPAQGKSCGSNCGCHGPAVEEDFEAQVQKVIEKVRPFLQMDGGDIELIAVEDTNALVRLHGACTHCSISDVHMKMGVEQAIKREIPEFGELIVIE